MQKVAIAIAINGPFLINFVIGIDGGVELDGASLLINSNSLSDKFLLSSGYDVTDLFQKKYQNIPKIPNE